jgi:hypothetical protein
MKNEDIDGVSLGGWFFPQRKFDEGKSCRWNQENLTDLERSSKISLVEDIDGLIKEL